MKTMNKDLLTGIALVVAVVIFSAWKTGDSLKNRNHNYVDQDTTAPRKKMHDKKEYRVGDLDEAMRDLDRAMADINKNMKVDLEKMDIELKKAVEELKKVDFDKIGREVEASLKEIDWEKTRGDVDKAMREAEKKIKEVDLEKVKREIAEAKKQIDAEKIQNHLNLSKIKETVDESLAKARVGIEKAKRELALLKEFTTELEKDGLIDKKKGYKLEIKNSELYINDIRQSKEVNDKYRKYFQEGDYVIKSGEENLKMR